MKTTRVSILAVGLAICLSGARADSQVTNALFTLLHDSTLTDDCLVCGRPSLIYPLRGTFELVLQDSNPLFDTSRVTNVLFRVGSETNPLYRITGSGHYRMGGEVALVQEMILEVQLNDKPLLFTNDSHAVMKRFPLMHVSLLQTQLNLLQFFSINLVAAPVREIWFSTISSFTSGNQTLRGTGGELLSANGRIVKSYSDLVAKLGIASNAAEPGLDALDLGPGGEVFFSLAENRSSTNLGAIQHGDLVSNRGRIVARNQELTAAFQIMPAVPDLGLDAVQVKDDGEILFSVKTNAFGEIGKLLRHGDVLSSKGQIIASNAQLLARFHPPVVKDYGLDAFYVWPNGEIWFSVEEGFQDQQLGQILPGDLLSDQGIVAFGNLELMSALAPIEDLADFGLDALFVITDVTAPAPPPRFTQIAYRHPARQARLPFGGPGGIWLEWSGAGRVSQVEKAADVTGPFQSLSPILPDGNFEDHSAAEQVGMGFYRLRSW